VSEEDARYLLGGGFERISPLPLPKKLQLHRPEQNPVYAIGSMEWQAEQKLKKDDEGRP
jgi:hypothetical protein